MPANEDTAAYRYWRDLVGSSPGEEAARQGVEHLLGLVAKGWVFHPGETDLVAEMGDYAEFGLAGGLRRFWPQLHQLVSGNPLLAGRLAELDERVHIAELNLDGFAAGTRRFDDGSALIRIDNGLLLTTFEVVQLFVQVSMPGPDVLSRQAETEAAVVLELMRAEYRLLRRHATPKGTVPTPVQGEAIGELSLAVNAFVLAHELSHLLLGHTGDGVPEQRQLDEITSDVLALNIISGSYCAEPVIQPSQAYGRLLGARLLFTSIELVERATYVRSGRTHPPAADRWEFVRQVAGRIFGASVPDGVDQIWRPMGRLPTAAELPLAEVGATLQSMQDRERFLGETADVRSAVNLIRLFRLTDAAPDDAERAEGAALAAAAEVELADQAAITWADLLRLQLGRRPDSGDEGVRVVGAAARILLG